MASNLPHFIIREHQISGRRRWTFQLLAENGEPLCTSEPYTTRAKASKGAARIARLAPIAPIMDEEEYRRADTWKALEESGG